MRSPLFLLIIMQVPAYDVSCLPSGNTRPGSATVGLSPLHPATIIGDRNDDSLALRLDFALQSGDHPHSLQRFVWSGNESSEAWRRLASRQAALWAVGLYSFARDYAGTQQAQAHRRSE